MTAGYQEDKPKPPDTNPDEWYDSHDNFLGPSYVQKKKASTWDEYYSNPSRKLPPNWGE